MATITNKSKLAMSIKLALPRVVDGKLKTVESIPAGASRKIDDATAARWRDVPGAQRALKNGTVTLEMN